MKTTKKTRNYHGGKTTPW